MHGEIEDIEEPLTDRSLRAATILVLLAGGTFSALEFVHWLVHGGFGPFLIGTAFALLLFFLLVLWSRLLSKGFQGLRSRGTILALGGLVITASFLFEHFLFA